LGIQTRIRADPSAYLKLVEILRNACEGALTDYDSILKIIELKTNKKRCIIRRLYTQKYNEDLITRLQNELSYEFKEVVIGNFKTSAQYDAYCLYEAMKGLGTKMEVLSEIISSRTPQELVAVKRVYAENYGEDLDNAITRKTSGKYQKLLLSLLQCK